MGFITPNCPYLIFCPVYGLNLGLHFTIPYFAPVQEVLWGQWVMLTAIHGEMCSTSALVEVYVVKCSEQIQVEVCLMFGVLFYIY